MTGAGSYWGRKKERCLRKNNNHVAVDVFIHVFVNDTARDPEKTNSLNNTTNYRASSFLGVGRTDLNIYYLPKRLVTLGVSNLFTKYVFCVG